MLNRTLTILNSKVDVFKTPSGVSSWALELKSSLKNSGRETDNFYSDLTELHKASLLIGIIETSEEGIKTFETLGHVLIHPLSIEHSSMLLDKELLHSRNLLTNSHLRDFDKYNLYLEEASMVPTKVLMEKGIAQKDLDRLPADIFRHITHFRLSYTESFRPGVLFNSDLDYADLFKSYTKQIGRKLDPLYTDTHLIKIEG